MAIRLLSDESIAGNLQFTGSNPTAIYRNSGGIQIKAENLRIKGVTTNEDIAAFIENGAVELFYDNSQKFITTSTGITVTGDATATSGKFISTSSSSGDYVRLYAGSGTAQWDIYGNGENLRLSENSSGGGLFQVDSGATFGGNVGIGTASPGARLHVDNSAADAIIRLSKGSSTIGNIDFVNEGNRFSIQDDGARRLVIDTSGNIGIGTNSPQSKLHIFTSTTNAPIRLQNDNGSGSAANIVLQTDSSGIANDGFGIYDVTNAAYNLTLQRFTTGSATSTRMEISPYVSGTKNVEAWLVGVDENHSIKFRVGAENKTYYYSYGGSGTDKGHNFYTGGLVSQQSLRLGITDDRIIALVNVGIGTTSPAEKLEVFGSIKSTSRAIAGGSTPGITLSYDTSNSIGLIETWTSKPIGIETAGVRRMTILSGGNVGIGTTSPSDLLSLVTTSGDCVIGLTGNSGGDPEIHMDSGNNRSGNIKYGDGSTAAMFRYAHSDVAFKFYAHNQTDVDFQIGENTSFFATSDLGIGTTSPSAKLHVSGDTGGADSIARFQNTNSAKVTRLQLLDSAGTVGDALIAYDHSNASSALHYLGMGVNNSTTLVINNNDNVGIANTSPNAPLQFQTSVATRKIVLYENVNNDFQFYGFGIENNTLLYSTGDNGDDHVFFSGQSSSTRREIARLKGNGDILFGTSTKANDFTYLELATNNRRILNIGSSTTSQQTLVNFRNPNGVVGGVSTDGPTTSFSGSSDYRLKENVTPMTGSLDRVSELKPSRFNFIGEEKTLDGFLAHEVSDVVPQAIIGTKDKVDKEGNPVYQQIDQSKLVPLLVGAIQELKAEIEILKNK